MRDNFLMAQGALAFRLAGGRVITASAVFDTYWRFAAKRQAIFMKRVERLPPPWTHDDVLSAHRFTNVYRASDRVSQYLIRRVLYTGSADAGEVFLRCLLFKIFNKVETWEYLCSQVGTPTLDSFEVERYAEALENRTRDASIYSAAYIMPSPPFGHARKHVNHLELVKRMIADKTWTRMLDAGSLEGAFRILRAYPSLGDFLAFQFTIDFNYGPAMSFEESEFVVAGPGARDGIRKCFIDTAGLSEADVIRFVADTAEEHFKRLGLDFQTLWGRRLQLIDCQNVFCEVDKYARVVHPEVTGRSGRSRIKQRFIPTTQPVPQWYPPKWNLLIEGEGAASTRQRLVSSARQREFNFFSENSGPTKRIVPA
jgi:hypothetical protein